MKKNLLLLCTLGWLVAGRAQTHSETMAPESAFTPIFNGTDLSGWQGDPTDWSVHDGAIVGRLDHVPMGDHYLTWQGGPVENFELRFDYWQPADWKFINGQAGIRFRAQSDNGGEHLSGYNVDIAGPSWNHTVLRDIGLAAGLHRELAFAGQSTVAREINGTNRLEIKGRMAITHDQLWANYRSGGWNQISILAQGNRLQIYVNGHLLNDCTDENEKAWRRSGLLALKLWMYQGPMLTVRFKNLRLRRLDAAEAVPQPVFISAPPTPSGENKPKSSATDRLKQLESLYQQGLISRDDYEKKKKEILDSL